MNHEYSTIALIFIFSIGSIIVFAGALLSEDIDELCDTDGKILKRAGGVWNCSNDLIGNSTGVRNNSGSYNLTFGTEGIWIKDTLGWNQEYIYFQSVGDPNREFFMWDESNSYFTLSDDWYSTGYLEVGTYLKLNSDIYTTGIGDDIWLGTTTQANAKFRGYANGNLTVKNISADNIIITREVWEDLRFPVESIKTTGASNIPDYVSFIGGTYVLAFDAGTMEQGYITLQTPHSRKENTDLKFHWHWVTPNTNLGNVVWCMEYTCADINDVFPATQRGCIIDAATGTANTHLITDYITYTNTLDFSSMCSIRIYRNATDSRDTYGSDAHLLEYDVHYINNKFGE